MKKYNLFILCLIVASVSFKCQMVTNENINYIGIKCDSLKLHESIVPFENNGDNYLNEENLEPPTITKYLFYEWQDFSFNVSCYYYFDSVEFKMDSLTMVITSSEDEIVLTEKFQTQIESRLIHNNYHFKQVLSKKSGGSFNKLIYKWR